MAGVRDELADARLALLARLQRSVHMVEHAVEGGADLADLGARVGLGVGDPFVEGHFAAVQGSSETRVAVDATRRRGRRATPTMAAPARDAATRPAAVTLTSTTMRVLRVSCTSVSGRPTMVLPPGFEEIR